MAKFKPGPTVAVISGRVGGIVFSRNRGGMYIRNGSMPTNPSSDYQTNIRSILAQRSAEWRSLTLVQRSAWENYARQNPVTNTIGDSFILSGQQAYVSINSRLAQAGDTLLTLPPIAVAPTPLLTFSVAADASDGTVTLTFTTTPLGADHRLWIYACSVFSAGISYVNNYLRLVKISAKAQATALNIGTEVEARCGDIIEDQVVFVTAAVFDSTTGLLSLPLRAHSTVQA